MMNAHIHVCIRICFHQIITLMYRLLSSFNLFELAFAYFIIRRNKLTSVEKQRITVGTKKLYKLDGGKIFSRHGNNYVHTARKSNESAANVKRFLLNKICIQDKVDCRTVVHSNLILGRTNEEFELSEMHDDVNIDFH